MSNMPKKRDCMVSPWINSDKCNKTCGGGTLTQTRTVTQRAANGGKSCPILRQKIPCNTQPCPGRVNCVTSPWSPWTDCSSQCGTGTQTRTRSITTYPSNDGTACPKILSESQPCNTQPLLDPKTQCSTCLNPLYAAPDCTECVNSEHDPNSDCTTCKNPLLEYPNCWECSSNKLLAPQECTTCLDENRVAPNCTECKKGYFLNGDYCEESIDCQMGGWGSWSNCDKNCGGGFQTATRIPIQRAKNGGAECPENVTRRPCNTQECPFSFTVRITNVPATIFLPINLNFKLNKDFIIRTNFEDYKINYQNWKDLDLNVCPAKAREDLNNNVTRRICPTIGELTNGITGTPESNFRTIGASVTNLPGRYKEGVWVDWGDGIIATGENGSINSHTYNSIGEYTIRVYGGSNYAHNMNVIATLNHYYDYGFKKPYEHSHNQYYSFSFTSPSLWTDDIGTRNSIIKFDSYGSFVFGNADTGIYDYNIMKNAFPNLIPNVDSIPKRK